MSQDFPLVWSYLQLNEVKLREREAGKFKGSNWYAFGYPKSMTLFEAPKIIVPDYNNVASFSYDNRGHFYKTGYGVLLKEGSHSPLYIIGLLNSKTLFWYLCEVGTMLRGGYVRFWTQFIEQLPIYQINSSDPDDKSRHNKMIELVERMLDMNKRLQAAKNAHEKDSLQRQIDATDHQIDRLVYQLYDLTDDEIKIVEESINV